MLVISLVLSGDGRHEMHLVCSTPDINFWVPTQDGTVQPPPVLEEGALLLQNKQRWWPFGNPPEGGGKFKRG